MQKCRWPPKEECTLKGPWQPSQILPEIQIQSTIKIVKTFRKGTNWVNKVPWVCQQCNLVGLRRKEGSSDIHTQQWGIMTYIQRMVIAIGLQPKVVCSRRCLEASNAALLVMSCCCLVQEGHTSATLTTVKQSSFDCRVCLKISSCLRQCPRMSQSCETDWFTDPQVAENHSSWLFFVFSGSF